MALCLEGATTRRIATRKREGIVYSADKYRETDGINLVWVR